MPFSHWPTRPRWANRARPDLWDGLPRPSETRATRVLTGFRGSAKAFQVRQFLRGPADLRGSFDELAEEVPVSGDERLAGPFLHRAIGRNATALDFPGEQIHDD